MVTLATVYERRNRLELARTVLEGARAVAERDPAVRNRLGLVELRAGNRAEALDHFRAAAALAPDYAEARANHGVLLADADDFEAAAVELEAAARHAPWSAAIQLDLGNAYRGAGELDRAEAAYRRALELDPALADAELNLAVLFLDGEKPGTPALARLEQAVAQLDAYERKGGADPKVAEYRKDAARAIERERKRLAREERDRLRREVDVRGSEPAAAPAPAGAPVPAAAPAASPARASAGEEREER
jgi:tetratricopeptide (TPR) repeat protein